MLVNRQEGQLWHPYTAFIIIESGVKTLHNEFPTSIFLGQLHFRWTHLVFRCRTQISNEDFWYLEDYISKQRLEIG